MNPGGVIKFLLTIYHNVAILNIKKILCIYEIGNCPMSENFQKTEYQFVVNQVSRAPVISHAANSGRAAVEQAPYLRSVIAQVPKS